MSTSMMLRSSMRLRVGKSIVLNLIDAFEPICGKDGKVESSENMLAIR